MLSMVILMKLLAEIALMSLLGQWIVGLLAGAKRDRNVFYKLFEVITKPVVGLTRGLMPRALHDRHMRRLAFLLLSLLWLVLTLAKIRLCLESGINICR